MLLTLKFNQLPHLIFWILFKKACNFHTDYIIFLEYVGHFVFDRLDIKFEFFAPKSIKIPAIENVHLLFVFWQDFLTIPTAVCRINTYLITMSIN